MLAQAFEKFSEMKSRVVRSEDEIRALNERIASLEHQRVEKEAELENARGELAKCREEKTAYERQLDDFVRRFSEAQARMLTCGILHALELSDDEDVGSGARF